MDISSGRGGRTKEKALECELSSLNPVLFEQFKDIQEVQSILHCKTMSLLSEGFTEYINHVGNGKELSSIVNFGLIPGGVFLRTGRQVALFTIVNPMDDQNVLGDDLARLVTSKNRIIQKIGKRAFSVHRLLIQFEARSTKRTAILSNKVKTSYPLGHIACRVHGESDMHEDQGSALSKGKRDSKAAC